MSYKVLVQSCLTKARAFEISNSVNLSLLRKSTNTMIIKHTANVTQTISKNSKNIMGKFLVDECQTDTNTQFLEDKSGGSKLFMDNNYWHQEDTIRDQDIKELLY